MKNNSSTQSTGTPQRVEDIATHLPGSCIYRAEFHPDNSFTLVYISSGVEAIAGISAKEIMANPDCLKATIDPWERKALLEQLEIALSTLEPINWEFPIITATQKAKRLLVRCSFNRKENGDVVSDGMLLDIAIRNDM